MEGWAETESVGASFVGRDEGGAGALRGLLLGENRSWTWRQSQMQAALAIHPDFLQHFLSDRTVASNPELSCR